MPSILLVEDDPDACETVRLALEPVVSVQSIDTLYAALAFLRTRSHEVCGVIVDLNLTDGSDNFGRIVLERLRDMSMPCVVFSGSIRTPADEQRYANEFGVLGTIGKDRAGVEGTNALAQLRESVKRMIAVSTGSLRDRVRGELEQVLVQREAGIDLERKQRDELVAQTERVAGKLAAASLAESEDRRLQALSRDVDSIRQEVLAKLDAATTMEALERLRTEIPRALGAL